MDADEDERGPANENESATPLVMTRSRSCMPTVMGGTSASETCAVIKLGAEAGPFENAVSTAGVAEEKVPKSTVGYTGRIGADGATGVGGTTRGDGVGVVV